MKNLIGFCVSLTPPSFLKCFPALCVCVCMCTGTDVHECGEARGHPQVVSSGTTCPPIFETFPHRPITPQVGYAGSPVNPGIHLSLFTITRIMGACHHAQLFRVGTGDPVSVLVLKGTCTLLTGLHPQGHFPAV